MIIMSYAGPGCYRCGSYSHFVADCPVTPYPAEAAAPPPARGRAAPPRLDDKPVPVYNLPDPEIARSWARDIREAMGWDNTAATRGEQRMAADQMADSRRDRLAGPGRASAGPAGL